MGRYYTNNETGHDQKFWFATQSSDALSKYGIAISEPRSIEYIIDDDEGIALVKKGIKDIEDRYPEFKKLLDEAEENDKDDQSIKFAQMHEEKTNPKFWKDMADHDLLSFIVREMEFSDYVNLQCEL